MTAFRRSLPAAACWLALSTAQAAPSTAVAVGGAVQVPKTQTLATLSALPAITQNVSFSSGNSGVQNHTYTGASLWSVLDASGIVTAPGVKNDLLNRYVLATGSDGYKVVFSLGELSPSFGNRPSLVAYAETVKGQSAPLGADGVARITAPGDGKGGRYVSNLASLTVRSSGSQQAGSGGGPSSGFSVSGTVQHGMSFDLAALQALPSVTRTIGSVTYTGTSLWSLLSSTAGLQLDPTVKNDVLGHYVVATGSDGYKALFSLGELDPSFGNQPDFIAYEADGVPLAGNGFARLIVPNDVKQGRYVSNLVSLEVFSAAPAVPEPATVSLMAAGLAGVAVLGRRRRLAAAR